MHGMYVEIKKNSSTFSPSLMKTRYIILLPIGAYGLGVLSVLELLSRNYPIDSGFTA
jgi:hypothetical protein